MRVCHVMAMSCFTACRGLGRIWETGCVKKQTGCVQFWHATLAIHSFSFLPHLQPKNQFFSPIIKCWATFLAQLLKTPEKPSFFSSFFSGRVYSFETGRDYHGCLNPWWPVSSVVHQFIVGYVKGRQCKHAAKQDVLILVFDVLCPPPPFSDSLLIILEHPVICFYFHRIRRYGHISDKSLISCLLFFSNLKTIFCYFFLAPFTEVEGVVIAIATHTEEKHGSCKVVITANTGDGDFNAANKCVVFDLPHNLIKGRSQISCNFGMTCYTQAFMPFGGLTQRRNMDRVRWSSL